MNTADFRFGFRVVGGRDRDRKLTDWSAAFRAHMLDDDKADNSQEAYLSAFQYSADFKHHLESTGTTRGFTGPTWAQWVWFDIDRDDIATALGDTIKLVVCISQRWDTHPDEMLLFFSGSKGFHVGIPSALWGPEPDGAFHTTCRNLAECLATLAGVTIDTGVYDRVRLFRAPNSRHPKTGLHKRAVGSEELFQITSEGILNIARHPQDVRLPDAPPLNLKAQDDWQEAMQLAGVIAQGRESIRQTKQLNAATLRFIREGESVGDRHRMLFSAAANLSELNCPSELAHALLTPAARDSGLTPADIRRQIECGLREGGPIHD